MAVYIVVALVAIAILWAAYRAFGGPVSGPQDNAALIQRAAALAMAAAGELAEGAAPARPLRRSLEGCAQLLERVDTSQLDAGQLSSHSLVASAVDDLTWAARLLETASFGTNPGLQAAVASLRSHADQCFGEVGVGPRSGVTEEVDSPA